MSIFSFLIKKNRTLCGPVLFALLRMAFFIRNQGASCVGPGTESSVVMRERDDDERLPRDPETDTSNRHIRPTSFLKVTQLIPLLSVAVKSVSPQNPQCRVVFL